MVEAVGIEPLRDASQDRDTTQQNRDETLTATGFETDAPDKAVTVTPHKNDASSQPNYAVFRTKFATGIGGLIGAVSMSNLPTQAKEAVIEGLRIVERRKDQGVRQPLAGDTSPANG